MGVMRCWRCNKCSGSGEFYGSLYRRPSRKRVLFGDRDYLLCCRGGANAMATILSSDGHGVARYREEIDRRWRWLKFQAVGRRGEEQSRSPHAQHFESY
eukprot:scaffold33092_cov73-Cyclotella_meneghiniana.AAC.1